MARTEATAHHTGDPAADPIAALAAERDRLGRGSTVENVCAALRERIAEGTLPSGTRLPEEALRDRMGVSRNTLREAFRVLAHERLVVHRMNRGVYVRVLDTGDVADIYAVRRALEVAGARAEPAPSRLAAVTAAVTDGEKAALAEDWSEVAGADLRFHRALGGLTGSERIDAYLDGLLAELRLAFSVMPDPGHFHEPFLRRNRVIADLLVKGKRAEAERELIRYLDDAQAVIINFMLAAAGERE